MARRGLDGSDLDRAVSLDGTQRQAAGERDDVRARIKSLSKEVGAARKAGDAERAEELAAESRTLGEEEKRLDADAAAAGDALRDLLLRIPNIPSADAPDGA